MQRADPRLERLFEEAAGYAVFAEMGTLGGPDGVGVPFEEGQAAGMATLPLAPVSLQSSGLPYAEVILFRTRQAVAAFKQRGLERAAQARAVVIVPGTKAELRFVDGVSVFIRGSGSVPEARAGRRAFAYLPYHREISAGSR